MAAVLPQQRDMKEFKRKKKNMKQERELER